MDSLKKICYYLIVLFIICFEIFAFFYPGFIDPFESKIALGLLIVIVVCKKISDYDIKLKKQLKNGGTYGNNFTGGTYRKVLWK